MKNPLLKLQSLAVYGIGAVSLALFTIYLGFMTSYYVLFFDGTFEMFEFYELLQVFNKEAFNIAIIFVALAILLFMFELHKFRPGLPGLLVVGGVSTFMVTRSLALLNVIPKYKRGYLSLDFTSLEDYEPTTFVFDAATVMHYTLIGLLAVFAIVAILTFVQRLREGKPLVRRLLV